MTHPLHAQLIPAGPPIRPRLPLSALEVNASLAALFNDPATRQQALALAADWATTRYPSAPARKDDLAMTTTDAPALPSLIERLSGAPDRLTCVDRLQLYATDETSDFDAEDAFEVASLLGEAAAEISRLQSALEARTEECAKVAERYATTWSVRATADDIAAAIRKLQEQS